MVLRKEHASLKRIRARSAIMSVVRRALLAMMEPLGRIYRALPCFFHALMRSAVDIVGSLMSTLGFPAPEMVFTGGGAEVVFLGVVTGFSSVTPSNRSASLAISRTWASRDRALIRSASFMFVARKWA